MNRKNRELREKLRKQIEKQIEKQYEDKIAGLERKLELKSRIIDKASNIYQHYMEMNIQLKRRNEELEEKVTSYEDWINRLQDFVNLPEEEREQEVRKYAEKRKADATFNSLLSTYSSIINRLFN